VRSPSSRLGDDLYNLYTIGLLWFVLPFYGVGLHTVLPSTWDQFDQAFSWAVPGALALGAWSGVRGGPLLVSRAAVLHELGSPVSRQRLLLPWVLRQAVAWAVLGAFGSTLALILSDRDGFGYASALQLSAAGALCGGGAVFVGVLALIATRRNDRWRLLGLAAATAVGVPILSTLSGVNFNSSLGLAILAVITGLVTTAAVMSLDQTPVEVLWHRATAVESMRSAMQRFDFQRVLLDLRSVTEQPQGVTSDLTAPQWLPLGLWRYLAAVRHTLGWHLTRLVSFAGLLAALYWRADLDQGIVAVGLAVCALLIGVEVSGSVASIADQLTLLVHYRHGSGRVLRGQVTTSVTIAIVIGLCCVGFGVGRNVESAAGTVLICGIGALAATVIARLGSPDIAALNDRFGSELLTGLLWGRALLGPIATLIVTAIVFRVLLLGDAPSSGLLLGAIAALFVAAFAISTHPLERGMA